MKASAIAFLAFIGQHSVASEVIVQDKTFALRSLQSIDKALFAQTEDEFCKNLNELESHLTDAYKDDSPYGTSEYECKCSKPSNVLVIDCSLTYNGSEKNFEQIILKANYDGMYEVIRTSWGDTFYGDNNYDDKRPQEHYVFDDGKLDSCSATGCKSCSICDDKESIAVDCSSLSPDASYTFECSDGYTGAYANTFDFGDIKTSGTSRHSVTTILGTIWTTFLVTYLL